MPPTVQLDAVRFRYPRGGFALEVPRLVLEPGRSLALTGPSGCGKTTLAHLVTGVLVPQAGSVRVAGRELAGMPDAARRAFRIANVGILFQDFGLLEYLDALDNILLPYHLDRGTGSLTAARTRASALADELGIASRLAQKPGALSAGERQRVALARALVTEPALVVADEPTGNLDPDNARRATALLTSSTSARGASLLTITHDPEVARAHDATLQLGGSAPACSRQGASDRSDGSVGSN
jgi:putative ABC transport system ATP-binding protein